MWCLACVGVICQNKRTTDVPADAMEEDVSSTSTPHDDSLSELGLLVARTEVCVTLFLTFRLPCPILICLSLNLSYSSDLGFFVLISCFVRHLLNCLCCYFLLFCLLFVLSQSYCILQFLIYLVLADFSPFSVFYFSNFLSAAFVNLCLLCCDKLTLFLGGT